MASHKQTFLSVCHRHDILKFGSFTLKSGRLSPYFFNAGSFSTAALLSSLASAYAQTISDAISAHTEPLDFDVIFGPAYKGIPLCAITAVKLAELDPQRFGGKEWCFNRKEVKDHGEGGSLVGAADLKGKKVLIIDDVVAGGDAKREAVGIIKNYGGVVSGIVVAVDRQEVVGGVEVSSKGRRLSAMGTLREELGVPMVAIVTLKDIIDYSRARLTPEQVKEMETYRQKYGSEDVDT